MNINYACKPNAKIDPCGGGTRCSVLRIGRSPAHPSRHPLNQITALRGSVTGCLVMSSRLQSGGCSLAFYVQFGIRAPGGDERLAAGRDAAEVLRLTSPWHGDLLEAASGHTPRLVCIRSRFPFLPGLWVEPPITSLHGQVPQEDSLPGKMSCGDGWGGDVMCAVCLCLSRGTWCTRRAPFPPE